MPNNRIAVRLNANPPRRIALGAIPYAERCVVISGARAHSLNRTQIKSVLKASGLRWQDGEWTSEKGRVDGGFYVDLKDLPVAQMRGFAFAF